MLLDGNAALMMVETAASNGWLMRLQQAYTCCVITNPTEKALRGSHFVSLFV